jgi:hypothetical protein
MEPVNPDLIGALSLAGGLAVAMLVLGTRTKMLELRENTLRCPSCRRLVRRGAICPCAN